MDNGSGTKVNIHFNNGSLIEGFKVSSELTEPLTIYEQIMNHPESKKGSTNQVWLWAIVTN